MRKLPFVSTHKHRLELAALEEGVFRSTWRTTEKATSGRGWLLRVACSHGGESSPAEEWPLFGRLAFSGSLGTMRGSWLHEEDDVNYRGQHGAADSLVLRSAV
ncbi:hypothetical protein IscW_ISCW015606 [Ixodes scapularis]|uniref:Uncharacterized protein n=1 Tax=Ixodes scapularis TaxID=6945 RepID=B7P0Z5_IXOSC|nr:hypothetical protein IscW_ISCW015606 [Ixodes scapularis]|eukprot:XP_002399725.1 hypothetical protein IscW_ISCW015606 [Ixodes scapularis]